MQYSSGKSRIAKNIVNEICKWEIENIGCNCKCNCRERERKKAFGQPILRDLLGREQTVRNVRCCNL